MTAESTFETHGPSYVTLPQQAWATFFEAFTDVLQGRRVEIEVIGLDLGDQIVAEYLPLEGLAYDRHSDTFVVYIAGASGSRDHAIRHPREILVGMGATGVELVVAIDARRHEHIVRLREPLMLPDAS